MGPRAGRPGRLAALAPLAALALLAVAPARGAPEDPAVAEFKKVWARATTDEQRQDAVARLGQAASVDAARILVKLVVDPASGWVVHDAAAEALAAVDRAEVVLWAGEAAAGKKAEKDPAARAAICDYLAARARAGDGAAARLLLPALADAHWSVRVAAVRGVAALRTPDAVDALVRCLAGSDARVAGDARRALAALTGERFPSTEEWTSWWAARREGYRLPDPKAPADGAEAEPERFRTVTRLGPPSSSMYDTSDTDRFLFVVDISYSMQVKVPVGDGAPSLSRLDYVKRSLVATITDQVHDEDRFNIIVFSDAPRAWRKEAARGDAGAKRKAVQWVEALQLEGDTNYADTLELAFQQPDVDTIYFLTDGTPTVGKTTVPDELLGLVRRWNAGRNLRLSTIGFFAGDAAAFNVVESKGAARALLRDLAAQNGGAFTFYE